MTCLFDRPIAFHRCFVELTGSVAGALFLSQAAYWQQRCKSPDGYWWKTREEWEEETGMRRCELESARKAASKFVHFIRRGIPAKTYYKVHIDLIISRLPETYHLDGGKPANCMVENQPTGRSETSRLYIETTSETTSETKYRGRFAPPTIEEVNLAAAKCGLPDCEAEKFFHFYASKGWKVGKAPMKSWSHALAGWRTRWQAERPKTLSEKIGDELHLGAVRYLNGSEKKKTYVCPDFNLKPLHDTAP